MPTIKKVSSKREMRHFILFPNDLYKGDLFYVPQLISFQKTLFSSRHNSFFKHADIALFLAYKGNVLAGRIAAIHNKLYIQHNKEPEGFFGFFESIDDNMVAAELIRSAELWLKDKGLRKMTGPENFTTNESCGILTEGFDDPPVFMMPYNKPYYSSILENIGLVPVMDLSSYKVVPNEASDRIGNLSEKVMKRLQLNDIIIRPISSKHFDQDIILMEQAYNHAFSQNWGFVPFTLEEFRESAYNLKKISDLDTILLAFHKDCCVGFIVNVPDFNQVLIHVRNGKLFPIGILELLKYKGRINRYRNLILGVVPEFRKMGIEFCLIARTFEILVQKGAIYAEAAYVMEDNVPMKQILKNLGSLPVKRYRIYQKTW